MLKLLDVQRILSGRILVLWAFLLLPSLSSTTAQTTSPPVTTKGEYATVNNTLYIQGGSLSTDGTQLTPGIFSLDLTVPWKDQSPPWTTLPSAGSGVAPLAWQQSMAPSGDKSQLISWDVQGYQITNYQLSNHAWGPALTYSTNNINWGGLHGVIPPTAPGVLGVLHMPNGCSSTTNLSASALCMYNLDTLAWTQSPMPTGYLPSDVSYYTFVYSNLRKSMVMYGGTSVFQNGPSPYLYEYLPATTAWNFLQTQAKGTLPGAIYSHCMVESTDYSKMIMFGGAIGNTTVTVIGSLFILDLATLTWTQGADAPQAQFRVGHACAVNGDSFVVWGGSNLQSMMSTTPLIYNIRLNQWVHDFVVSGALPTASTSTGSRPSGSSGAQPSRVPNTGQPTTEKSSSGSGGIIGGVVGGVAVLAAVGFFFYRRSKKHQPISALTHVDEDRRTREYVSRQDDSSHPEGGQSQWIPLHESDKALPMQTSHFSNSNDGSPLTYQGSLLTSTSASPPNLSPRPASNPHAIIGSYEMVGMPTMDLRNPQALNAGSMAMLGGPTVVSQSRNGSSSGGHAPYFPPPPPASLPYSNLESPSSSRGVSETANDDVMAKKLALMKAQYEFELSRLRLEQESLAERQRQG